MFISIQKDCVLVWKILLDKDILKIMLTSVKGRRTVIAEMNAESFEV